MKTVSLTMEQAAIALEIIENDIEMSEFSCPDYRNTEEMMHNLNRATLAERLRNAIATPPERR